MQEEDRKVKQQIILQALAKCASVTTACALAEVPRRTFYHWQKNKVFAEDVRDAMEQGNDCLDDTIIFRALEGVSEPLISMGRLIYEAVPALDAEGNPLQDKHGNPVTKQGAQVLVKKPSDRLLELAAKSRMKKYRERTDLDLLDQINENTGGAITLNTRSMTSEELATLKQIGQAIKARTEEREKR